MRELLSVGGSSQALRAREDSRFDFKVNKQLKLIPEEISSQFGMGLDERILLHLRLISDSANSIARSWPGLAQRYSLKVSNPTKGWSFFQLSRLFFVWKLASLSMASPTVSLLGIWRWWPRTKCTESDISWDVILDRGLNSYLNHYLYPYMSHDHYP